MSNGTIKVKQLVQGLKDVTVYGSKDVDIRGVTAYSKEVAPDSLFIVKKGGEKFIPEALNAGASVIAADLFNPFLEKKIVQLICPDLERLEELISSRFYGNPSSHLFMIGVTGTSGKTTTTYLLYQLLKDSALIGTIATIVGEHHFPSQYTTPDLLFIDKVLSEAVACGCQTVTMEVSSHGLAQGRVRTFNFDVAVFMNLSQEHLDYHKTMEQYAEAKAKLFDLLKPNGWAVYNYDDPWHPKLLSSCKANKLSFGFHPEAELRMANFEPSAQGISFDISYLGENYRVKSSLIGRFNAYNLAAAIGCGLVKGHPLRDLVEGLRKCQAAPGRLQRVENRRGIHIFVDYAHKPDALKNVLETLQALKKGRLITVFGCGGDRDQLKRPQMGEIAEKYSDQVIITNDNPRSEDPFKIAQAILEGINDKKNVLIELDRKEAIFKALAMAQKGDIVLIAGKGHEQVQIFSSYTLPFDDVKIATLAAS